MSDPQKLYPFRLTLMGRESAVADGAAVLPAFCGGGFTVRVDFSNPDGGRRHGYAGGLHYTRRYRKGARWDFGDGTVADGPSATHAYSRPGRYTVRARLYDRDGTLTEAGYAVKLIVREPLPNLVRVLPGFTPPAAIPAGGAALAGRLLATVSDGGAAPAVVPSVARTGCPSWFELPAAPGATLLPHHCFMRDAGGAAEVRLEPVERYEPDYVRVYGRYTTERQSGRLVPELWADLPLPPLPIPDPDAPVANADDPAARYGDIYTSVPVSTGPRPDDAVEMGAAATLDVIFKCDCTTGGTPLRLHFDLDREAVPRFRTDEAPSFVNTAPAGIAVDVVQNDPDRIRFAASRDGALHSVRRGGEGEMDCDAVLAGGAALGYAGQLYIMPTVYYDPQSFKDGAVAVSPPCYHPKETEWNVTVSPYQGEDPDGFAPEDNSPCAMASDGGFRGWYALARTCYGRVFDQVFTMSDTNGSRPLRLRLRPADIDAIVVPRETLLHQDPRALYDAYCVHPSLAGADNLRAALEGLGKADLDYVLTRAVRFFDDNADFRRCHLSALRDLLVSMGEETAADALEADSIRDLRDLVRILTMNHSQLVGHCVERTLSEEGEELLVDDILYTDADGLVVLVERDGRTLMPARPSRVRVTDRFTGESTPRTLLGVPKACYIARMPQSTAQEALERVEAAYRLGDITPSWGWGLLLPERFDTAPSGSGVRERLISSYYRFNVETTRSQQVFEGAFLDPSSISGAMNLPSAWDATREYGLVHALLLKTLYGNAGVSRAEGDSWMLTEGMPTPTASPCRIREDLHLDSLEFVDETSRGLRFSLTRRKGGADLGEAPDFATSTILRLWAEKVGTRILTAAEVSAMGGETVAFKPTPCSEGAEPALSEALHAAGLRVSTEETIDDAVALGVPTMLSCAFRFEDGRVVHESVAERLPEHTLYPTTGNAAEGGAALEVVLAGGKAYRPVRIVGEMAAEMDGVQTRYTFTKLFYEEADSLDEAVARSVPDGEPERVTTSQVSKGTRFVRCYRELATALHTMAADIDPDTGDILLYAGRIGRYAAGLDSWDAAGDGSDPNAPGNAVLTWDDPQSWGGETSAWDPRGVKWSAVEAAKG